MKKEKCILSVIVPVYNVEEYLNKCVNSILQQTFSEFELILVDDGSTDKSAELCDEYALKDDRISVMHIENSGTFQARKIGVQHASGEFVTFSDADDWIEYNAFETAMQIIKKYNPDIFTYMYSYEGETREKHLYEEKLYYEEEIKNIIIPNMMFDLTIGIRRLNPSLACKYIKKELFMKVAESITDRITLGEDALVTYPAVCMAKSIFVSNSRLYHYRNNLSSCTHTFPVERVNEIMAFQSNMTRILHDVNMFEELNCQLECYVRTFVAMVVRNWFGMELSVIPYTFPYESVPKDSKVIIYGAGKVGKSYITELKIKKYAQIVGWVDKNYKQIKSYNHVEVWNPELIKEQEFDILLIAVFDKKVAFNIKMELMNMGIAEKKIVWVKPVCIG